MPGKPEFELVACTNWESGKLESADNNSVNGDTEIFLDAVNIKGTLANPSEGIWIAVYLKVAI